MPTFKRRYSIIECLSLLLLYFNLSRFLNETGRPACRQTGPEQFQDTYEYDYIALRISNLKKYKQMKPAWPEQFQDTYEHDYIALRISNLKKYKQMKPVGPEQFQDTYEHDYIALRISI